MAIIVEEEKNGVNLVRLLGWLGVLGVIASAVYYVFFAAPELISIKPPENFTNITPIAAITLHPENVLNSQTFNALKPPPFPLPTAKGPAGVGRANPFVSP